MGYFVEDAVLCPLETHQTAVIGGAMNPDRLDRAQAPWFATDTSSDLDNDVIRAMADAGEFDGTLGVLSASQQGPDDAILALLDELGVDVAESAVIDAPSATSPPRTPQQRPSPSGSASPGSTRSSPAATPACSGPTPLPLRTTVHSCSPRTPTPSTPTSSATAPT